MILHVGRWRNSDCIELASCTRESWRDEKQNQMQRIPVGRLWQPKPKKRLFNLTNYILLWVRQNKHVLVNVRNETLGCAAAKCFAKFIYYRRRPKYVMRFWWLKRLVYTRLQALYSFIYNCETTAATGANRFWETNVSQRQFAPVAAVVSQL